MKRLLPLAALFLTLCLSACSGGYTAQEPCAYCGDTPTKEYTTTSVRPTAPPVLSATNPRLPGTLPMGLDSRHLSVRIATKLTMQSDTERNTIGGKNHGFF